MRCEAAAVALEYAQGGGACIGLHDSHETLKAGTGSGGTSLKARDALARDRFFVTTAWAGGPNPTQRAETRFRAVR